MIRVFHDGDVGDVSSGGHAAMQCAGLADVAAPASLMIIRSVSTVCLLKPMARRTEAISTQRVRICINSHRIRV